MATLRYRKKPVEIETIQFTGENWLEIKEWVGPKAGQDPYDNECFISTLEGSMDVSKGDWVIKGVKGEFYPCKPDIFALTYELVER